MRGRKGGNWESGKAEAGSGLATDFEVIPDRDRAIQPNKGKRPTGVFQTIVSAFPISRFPFWFCRL